MVLHFDAGVGDSGAETVRDLLNTSWDSTVDFN